MSAFVVHSVPGSPYGRAVLATLEVKRAPHRLAPIPPGTLGSEIHLRRHPFGKIPVLEHDGFMLYETQAILRYLDRVLPDPALTPGDPRAAARMDQVMNVTDWYLFQGVNNVIGFQRVVGPRLLGLVPDEAIVAAAMPKARQVFRALGEALGSSPYFGGDDLSLADLMVAPHVDFLALTPEWAALSAEAPNLAPWLARMNTRPDFAATTWEKVAALAAAS